MKVKKDSWFSKYIPTPQSVKDNPYLSFMGSTLHHPALWHWHRKGVAAGVAMGVFFGFLIPVAQMPASAIAAVVLRANVPMALASTFVTNPITFAPVYYAAYKFGGWVLGENTEHAAQVDTGLYGASMKGQTVALDQWQEYLLNQTGAGYVYKSVGEVGSAGVKSLSTVVGAVLPKASHATAIAPMSGGVTGVNEIIHSKAALDIQTVIEKAVKPGHEVPVQLAAVGGAVLRGGVDPAAESKGAEGGGSAQSVNTQVQQVAQVLEKMNAEQKMHALEKIDQKALVSVSVTKLDATDSTIGGALVGAQGTGKVESQSEQSGENLGWGAKMGQWWDKSVEYITGVGKPLVVGLVTFAFFFSTLIYFGINWFWIWRVQSKRKKRTVKVANEKMAKQQGGANALGSEV